MKRDDDVPEFAAAALEAEGGVDRAARDVLGALAVALPPVRPRDELRARLLASAARPEERYAPFHTRLSRLLDLGVERLTQIFRAAADESNWERPPIAGMSLFHFEGGPALAGADTGLVRMEAGSEFPLHEHLGKERVLVLSGGYLDSSGTTYGAGQSQEMASGSAHSYVVLPDAPCVFCVVLEGGITIGGKRFG